MRTVLASFHALKYARDVLGLIAFLALFIALPNLHGSVAAFLENSRFGLAWVVGMIVGVPIMTFQIGMHLWGGLRFDGAALVLEGDDLVFAGPYRRLKASSIRSVTVEEGNLCFELVDGRLRRVRMIGWAEEPNAIRDRLRELADAVPKDDTPLNFR